MARKVYRTGRIFILHREAREVWGAVRDRRAGRIDVWLAAAADGLPETWMAPHAEMAFTRQCATP